MPDLQYNDDAILQVIALQELAELCVEVTDDMRGRGTRIWLLEELADVLIVVLQLKDVYKFTDEDFAKTLNVKLEAFEQKVIDAKAKNEQ